MPFFIPGRRLLRTLAIASVVSSAALQSQAACTGQAIASVEELRAVLALPGSAKSGRTFCMAPGRYDSLTYEDFINAFNDIDPERPVVFEAANPADPPVLNRWVFASHAPGEGKTAEGEESWRARDDGPVNGNAVLRDLAFDLGDDPLLPAHERGFRGIRPAIRLGLGGVTQNVTLERIHVTGPLGDAREDERESANDLTGIFGRTTRDIIIRDSRFERIANAIAIGGENLLIEGNRMRHGWSDLIRIVPQLTRMATRACRDTDGVVIRRNMVYDHWSNNRLHPDVVQMFADSGISCSIRNVVIEQNLAFPGRDGLLQPGFPTGARDTAPVSVPETLPAVPGQLNRLIGTGTTQLPKAACSGELQQIYVRLQEGGPLSVVPQPGDRFELMGKPLSPQVTLAVPRETWRFVCRPDRQGQWTPLRRLPVLQGVFVNSLPREAGYHDITIRNNIMWVMNRAVDMRDPDNTNVLIEGNSFLRPWPGDLDGDGTANTGNDGFLKTEPGADFILRGSDAYTVRGNVASYSYKIDGRDNDMVMTHSLPGQALLVARFDVKPGPSLMPLTPEEAVRLARPRPGGPLDGAGLGAVGTTPMEDPVDWSWVSVPW